MVLKGRVLNSQSGQPLSGVSVSDGRNFAVTDAEGAYTLERWDGAHVLFVNLLTEGHNDWFYYLENGREIYDFSLLPVNTQSDFCFFHVSDTEIDGREYMDCATFMNRLVKEHKPAFFSHTGDLGRTSVARHYLVMNRETMGCPVRYSIGNHDFVSKTYGEELYERLYGPTWYSFDCGDIHFVTLSIGRGDNPSGYQPTDQWLWLAEDLRRNRNGKRVIVLNHDRCNPDELGFTVSVGEDSLNLREHGLLAWVFGHFHVHLLHNNDGVFNICTACPDCGGIDSSPSAVRKIEIHGEELSSKMLFDRLNTEQDSSVWSANLQGNVEFCTPVMQNGDIFVATNDDGYPKKCGIYRINAQSGETVWFYPTADGIKGNIAVDEESLFAQDTQGVVYCLNLCDGSLNWSQKCDLIKVAYTRSGVCLYGDTVLAGNAKHPHAYRKSDGKLLWSTDFGKGENTPACMVIDEKRDRVLVGTHWFALNALQLADGSLAWQNKPMPMWFRTETPLVIGDRIYTAGLDSAVILNAEDGSILLQKDLGIRLDVCGAPVADGDLLYYPTAKDGVIALDRETLEVKKRFDCGGNVMSTSPYVLMGEKTVEGSVVISGNELIFTASDGCLYRYNKNTEKLLQKISLGAPSIVSPVVTEDAIYTADYSGTIKKFNRH